MGRIKLIDGMMEVENLGYITAGKPGENVIAFKSKTLRVPIPHDRKVDDQFAACEVRGNSMALCGLVNGDKIVVRTNAKLDDIESGRIVIVEYMGGLNLKKLMANRSGRIYFAAAYEIDGAEIIPHGVGVRFRGVAKMMYRFY